MYSIYYMYIVYTIDFKVLLLTKVIILWNTNLIKEFKNKELDYDNICKRIKNNKMFYDLFSTFKDTPNF